MNDFNTTQNNCVDDFLLCFNKNNNMLPLCNSV